MTEHAGTRTMITVMLIEKIKPQRMLYNNIINLTDAQHYYTDSPQTWAADLESLSVEDFPKLIAALMAQPKTSSRQLLMLIIFLVGLFLSA